MPIYEYRCQDCGHELDALQKLNDAPLEECPDCGEARLKRLISAPAFRLKGAGWYETDFKSDKERRRNLADSSDGSGESGKSAGNGGDGGKAGNGGDGGKAGNAGEGKSSGKAEAGAAGADKSSGSGKSESGGTGGSKSESGEKKAGTKKGSGTEAA